MEPTGTPKEAPNQGTAISKLCAFALDPAERMKAVRIAWEGYEKQSDRENKLFKYVLIVGGCYLLLVAPVEGLVWIVASIVCFIANALVKGKNPVIQNANKRTRLLQPAFLAH